MNCVLDEQKHEDLDYHPYVASCNKACRKSAIGTFSYGTIVHWSRKWEWPWAFNFVKDGDCVLDVGADYTFTSSLVEKCSKVYAHKTWYDLWREGDLMDNVFQQGPTDYKHLYNTYRDKMSLLFGYPHNVFPKNKFDAITCISTLEHVPKEHVDKWIVPMWEALKPGGRLIMTIDWDTGIPGFGTRTRQFHNHDLSKSPLKDGILVWPDNDYLPIFHGWIPKEWEGAQTNTFMEDGVPVPVGVFGVVLEKPNNTHN